ncbi:DUF21 domain-containing protein [Gloeothece verrucosa]|uniref:CNNM transmembrane domain-containing protein n=1 Tax=Gloeothece verrucosa (strain PCC 7822) TaxID=497965 RepID=E0UET0_GLOV7|nr:DUF21 domain-containing protein [Gloeothece verrucosa]ADN13060.1 protein of unknown function DUF21 [Gloeothece verrucosa PCC 7822]
MPHLLIVALLVLVGSALCACTETAILSVSPLRVRHLAQSNNQATKVLLNIRQNINHTFATIVMINNLFNNSQIRPYSFLKKPLKIYYFIN